MNNYDIEKVKYIFARLFVTAIQNETNLTAFTRGLANSDFVKKIEADKYDDYFNKSITDIFESIVTSYIKEDNSFGIYNDAYWSGISYFNLYLKLKKPFSYLFLKLPLEKMLDIYPVYHEMDFSSLVEYFEQLEQEKTILRALCEEQHISLSKLSKGTGISINTLAKYNANDSALYKASFQNVIEIATFFDAPISLFINELLD
ncbi:MAG: helix-turn-helix transcriptional regulator [Bacilli bacterium]|nr:helix-turn-helix transcriptional regulator [Bacilli bacterium]